MNRIISFPPIADKNSKILILGTMPGKDSLRMGQYYANSRNSFWKIIFTICETPFSYDYEIRRKILLKNNIAVWDTLKACIRESSADADITASEPNNIEEFLAKHESVRAIFCNGKDAMFYLILHFPKIKTEKLYLPSTSAANAIGWERKLKEWSIILEHLN